MTDPINHNGGTPPQVAPSSLGPLLERNRAFAATGAHAGLTMRPRQAVLLVTCLDPRVDPAAFLGVELGDAPVIRNAGGRVTDAVIDDIAFIGQLARTMVGEGPLFEVAVVHHTGCGNRLLADPGFRQALAERAAVDEAVLAERAVVDPVATVRADVARLLRSTSVPPHLTVSGHVYDVETGRVATIVDRSPIQPAQGVPAA
jgi:carbonic anhydrase